MKINWILINYNLATSPISPLTCVPGWLLRLLISLLETDLRCMYVLWTYRVKHSLLSKKLVEKGLSELYIRLLLVMYQEQTANVRWNYETSYNFPLSNGVKQGAVLSAVLFCVYADDLYKLLRKQKSGCWISAEYNGVVGSSDDLLLLLPSLDPLQEMLVTCETYAKEHNLQFSTDVIPSKTKTKCIAFVKDKREIKHDIMW